MANPLAYHKAIQNEQHVFLYCVSGRCSSTAFQRIINSSNKVWLWGEPRGIINNAVSWINNMKEVNGRDVVKLSLSRMYQSYNDNKHLEFYPNAIGNLDSTIELINSSISNILKPWAPKVRRFGFKDIDMVSIQTLEHLKEIYPQSISIFCFRNPILQWPSVCKLDRAISQSKNVNWFLDHYFRMSKTYMEFAQKYGIKAFIENNDLRDEAKVNEIIKYLNIPKIDSSLINSNVGSFESLKDKLTTLEEEIILNSDAYKNYLLMRDISLSFYKTKDN